MPGESCSASTAQNWLIQTTCLPINKIALSVGYDDAVYFTRIFRKHNGIPPGEFKKRYAEMRNGPG
jgi:AraC family transcriptional regulator of arabinose operon